MQGQNVESLLSQVVELLKQSQGNQKLGFVEKNLYIYPGKQDELKKGIAWYYRENDENVSIGDKILRARLLGVYATTVKNSFGESEKLDVKLQGDDRLYIIRTGISTVASKRLLHSLLALPVTAGSVIDISADALDKAASFNVYMNGKLAKFNWNPNIDIQGAIAQIQRKLLGQPSGNTGFQARTSSGARPVTKPAQQKPYVEPGEPVGGDRGKLFKLFIEKLLEYTPKLNRNWVQNQIKLYSPDGDITKVPDNAQLNLIRDICVESAVEVGVDPTQAMQDYQSCLDVGKSQKRKVGDSAIAFLETLLTF